MTKPNILFMGTPAFAIPALNGLVQNAYRVIGVVTQPDRPQGRGRATASSPVKRRAEELGVAVFQPERIRDSHFLETFRRLAPDLVIAAAFGQILPGEIIHGPKAGCINIHPSLLPKYRGAAPINWALIRGEEKTGVTIMRMDEGMDSGDILLQEETPIGEEETFGELHDRLADMGARLLLRALAMQEAGTLVPLSQDRRLATLAPRLGREDGLIRWDAGAKGIVALIRGLSPTPCAYTCINGKKLKIFLAKSEMAAVTEVPGTIAGDTSTGLRVASRGGYVVITEVQLEGKKRMAINEFLRGFRIEPGQVLG